MAKNSAILMGKIESDKYVFEIYKDRSSWYVNATDKACTDFSFLKWTSGRTKKAVLRTINAFVN